MADMRPGFGGLVSETNYWNDFLASSEPEYSIRAIEAAAAPFDGIEAEAAYWSNWEELFDIGRMEMWEPENLENGEFHGANAVDFYLGPRRIIQPRDSFIERMMWLDEWVVDTFSLCNVSDC